MNANISPIDYTADQDGMVPGERARARVRTRLEFRAGDGPLIAIEPDYAIELERADQSMVMSWQEDGQPMNASIPLVEFNEFIGTGKLVVES